MRQKDFFREPRIEETRDPEVTRLNSLLNPLILKHGRKAVMKFIEQYTNGTGQVVVENWVSNQHVPSSGIQRGIVNALKDLTEHPDTLPVVEHKAPTKPEAKPAAPALKKVAAQEAGTESPEQGKKPKTARKKDRPKAMTKQEGIALNEQLLKELMEKAGYKEPEIKIKNDEDYRKLEEKLRKEGKIE